MTVGSRSSMIARGTYLPADVYLKKVPDESSLEYVSGLASMPSGEIPCSRQKSYQQAFPTWIPPWPTLMEMIYLILMLFWEMLKKVFWFYYKRMLFKCSINNDQISEFKFLNKTHYSILFLSNLNKFIK